MICTSWRNHLINNAFQDTAEYYRPKRHYFCVVCIYDLATHEQYLIDIIIPEKWLALCR